mgnify:FL=1
MGGGHSSSTSSQEVKQRELSQEEKDLIAAQTRYMQSIQPAVDKLVQKSNSSIDNVYQPDWTQAHNEMSSALNNATNQIQGLSKYTDQLNSISNGELPQSYLQNMQTVYNNMYKSSMGSGLNDLASRGVINSSALNNATNQIQKNLTNQMAQDYSNNLSQAANLTNNALSQNLNLINSQVQNANDKYNLNSSTQANSMYLPSQWLALASGVNASGNNTLNSVGNVYNNASYISTTTNTRSKTGLF